MKPRAQQIAISYVSTMVFCVAIAVFLWSFNYPAPFLALITVSLAIGLTINTAFTAFAAPLNAHLSPYITPVLLTTAGLIIGLLIAGTLVARQPLLFFTGNWHTLLLGVFFGSIGFLLIGTRMRLQEARVKLAEIQAAQQTRERQLVETQLRLLQAQIEPHFLFNTLANITSTIRTSPQCAETTLLHLTTWLRSSLSRTRQKETTLGDELELLQAFLEINKMRLQERLTYQISVPPGLHHHRLPPLLLQPLVENALTHGIEPKEVGGEIEIVAKVLPEEDCLHLQVHDNGMGMNTAHAGEGIGLKNVCERLYALYGTRASFTLKENSAGGMTAELALPTPPH